MVTTRNVTTGSLRLHPIWSYLYPYNAHKAVYTNQRKFCFQQSLSHSCTRVYRSTAVFVFIVTMSWDSQAKQITQTRKILNNTIRILSIVYIYNQCRTIPHPVRNRQPPPPPPPRNSTKPTITTTRQHETDNIQPHTSTKPAATT